MLVPKRGCLLVFEAYRGRQEFGEGEKKRERRKEKKEKEKGEERERLTGGSRPHLSG